MESFIANAPTIALLFFFIAFVGICIWLVMPGAKQKFQKLAEIPLKEGRNDHE